MPLCLILAGPPGAGKGTQASRIAEKFKMPIVSTGALIRACIKEESEEEKRQLIEILGENYRERLLEIIGKELVDKIKELHDKGVLLPDEIILNLVKKVLSSIDISRGVILDGVPRTIEQAKGIEKIINEIGNLRMLVIELVVPKKECRRRILVVRKQEHPERADQEASVFERRWKEYETKTKPMIEYLRERGYVISVGGHASKDEVTNRIFQIIEKELSK